MAEIVEKINELRALPEDQHLFCPRVGDDASVYYPEDVASDPPETDPAVLKERKQILQEAESRKWTALDAAQILAYTDDDAVPFKDWLASRLDGLMQNCDVCVRVFYQSRAAWRARLVDSYDEDNISEFLQVVDEQCLDRIKKGLDEANDILGKALPKTRSVRLLPNECTYAFFEALSCDALIKSEDLLEKHFDQPFDMVQTKKRLKIQTYLPAMTRFLFSKNPRRHKWATDSWSTFKRNMLKSEFEWAVRDYFEAVMMEVQFTNLNLSMVPLFWSGARLIIGKMEKELIEDTLRGLEGNFHKTMLDHLSLKSEAFLDIIATMKELIEKSPTDFWEGMNAVTPSIATVVEQVFNSPVLNQLLLAVDPKEEQSMENLHAAFDWVTPLLSSIKDAHLGPAIRPFANALLGRFQSDRYSQTARDFCFKQCLKVLSYAFRKMGDGPKTPQNFVGQPAVNGVLDMLSSHIGMLVTRLKFFKSKEDYKEDLQLVLFVIQYAFQLEAQSLVVERELITKKQPSPTETPPSSPIWQTVLSAIDSNSLDLAIHLLIAGRSLIGLEPFKMIKETDPVPLTVKHFNNRFQLLSRSITSVVERLSEFNPSQLQALFGNSIQASAIVSPLFSSIEDTRNSAIELLKVISSEDERREALQHILKAQYGPVIQGISNSLRVVASRKAFAPFPSTIRMCSDIIDVLCNPQDGLLRAQDFDAGDQGVTMNFWRNLWSFLKMIFATTEGWSMTGLYAKSLMMDFCRDSMQFADQLFDQCSIFATALKGSVSDSEEGISKTEWLKQLLAEPASAMQGLAFWLRLRDEFLSSKSVSLISKILIRLRNVSIEISTDTLVYIEDVLSGERRAKLSMAQQAELQQSLETHLGRPLVKEEEVKPKQASLDSFVAKGISATTKADLMAKLTPGMNQFQERREQLRVAEQLEAARKKKEKQKAAEEEQRSAKTADFKEKRRLQLQKREQEKAAAKAKAQAARSGTDQAGSALDNLGVLGKDHAAKGEGLMHSSDESGDSEGDIDEDLFGIKKPNVASGPKTNIVNINVPRPTKKKRIVHSAHQKRARLAPDLTNLHRTILGWDYFHEGDFPPNSRPEIYSKVLSTFRTSNDYQATFEPLLILEAWQGFVKAREEMQAKPYEVRITSRSSVDAFQELGSTMTHNENKEVFISEGDIVLLSLSGSPSADERTCLARVFKVNRKQQHLEVNYRVVPGNPLGNALKPNSMVMGTKLQSMTPLEREYGALKGLIYYDLCDEIIKATPSPLLPYKDHHTDPIIANYNVNKAQAKAIKSAIDNDGFTLIQGPPGSGKTKTITAIVGAVLSETLKNRGTTITMPGQQRSEAATKKLLVCAPSNAAVDELVMRFKAGIKTLNGEARKVNIVRLGRSDAIKADVQDVTLEELVNKKMGVDSSNDGDRQKQQKIFQEHKAVSEQLRNAYQQRDSGEAKGEAADKLAGDIAALKQRKTALGTQIDTIKDNEKTAGRTADINRRRAQEAVLNDAHIVCATLSGSGHDMFQNLPVDFETVIVDEAAQCVEMSALIPLKYGCAKCILVGDPKQLPPTVFSKEAARFQYEQSLFVRMQKNHPDDVHLLDTQYRMHPEISLFPSRTFYDGKLLDGGDMAGLRKQPWHTSMLLGPYRFFDVQGQQQAAPKGHSLINIAEINVAMQLYHRLTSDYANLDFKGKVGIITPYKSQLRELKTKFAAKYGQNILDDIDFNTTDAFQGRESEVIIFSCVRASPAGGIGFLQDIRRMNVGLTRAKSSLWVLGNSQSLVRGEFWRKLVVDAKERKRFTDGDLKGMLNKHSSKFPAPKEGYIQPNLPSPEVKSEPMSRTGSATSNDSSNSDRKPIKQEIKQEIKEEPRKDIKAEQGLVHHAKRKFDNDPIDNVVEDVKNQSSDVEMLDDASDAASNTLNGGSGRSTPMSEAARNSATPAAENGKRENGSATPIPPEPGNVMGGMIKPKIRRRPRAQADPFIKTKKPKTG